MKEKKNTVTLKNLQGQQKYALLKSCTPKLSKEETAKARS